MKYWKEEGENFVRQIEEKCDSVETDPRTTRKVFGKYQEALNNPPERKEVNIKGNAENGKEIFQQIANAIALSDRQNFRFYSQQNKKKENKEGAGLSLSAKLAIGGISLVVLGILMLLIAKIRAKKKKKTTSRFSLKSLYEVPSRLDETKKVFFLVNRLIPRRPFSTH